MGLSDYEEKLASEALFKRTNKCMTAEERANQAILDAASIMTGDGTVDITDIDRLRVCLTHQMREAILEEREACAKIVEDDDCECGCNRYQPRIAQAIRERE